MLPVCMTMEQAGELLGMDKRRVSAAWLDGRLTGVKIRGRVMIHSKSVLAYRR